MSNRTIAKFGGLVILFALSCGLLLSSCSLAPSSSGKRYDVNASAVSSDYTKPVTVGHIESNEIEESSGVAASLCQPDVLWTHNDSGDDAFIFALNLKGKHLGTWRVSNAQNDDWEDMATYKDASGTCFLYIGDIGNNKGERAEQKIYRLKEPVISPGGAASNKKNPLQTDPAQAVVFKYPDSPHDAETLMVRPQTGEVYVLTKRMEGPSLVFKFLPQFGAAQSVTAQKVGEVSLPAVPNGLLTSGGISPDATRVVVCDYSAGYELSSPTSASFDEIWKSRPVPIDLGKRKHGEAITFAPDGRSILGTNEGKQAEIFEVKRK